MRRVLWVSIPTYAAPVQVALDAEDRLDLLCETVLRLLAAGPQSIDDIVRKLAIPTDIAQSAVNLLLDERLCLPLEGSEAIFVANDAEDVAVAGRALEPGWVFVAPHTCTLVPELWLDRDLPGEARGARGPSAVDGDEVVIRSSSPGAKSSLKEVVLDYELRLLAGWPNLRIKPVRMAAEADDDDWDDEESPEMQEGLPNLRMVPLPGHGAPRARSILRDSARELLQGPWKPTQIWSKVLLIPRVSAQPLAVFHSPVVTLPGDVEDVDSEGQVDGRLGRWIADNVPDVHAEVERRRMAMFEAARIPGPIGTAAELDRRVASHRAGAGWDIESLRRAMPDVAARIENAHKHLIQWEADPGSYLDACSAYEHAIEEIGITLRTEAREHILGWWEKVHRLPRKERDGAVESRCGDESVRRVFDRLGLAEAVRPSWPHICRSVRTPKTVEAAIEKIRRDETGFGESITIWLLPLVLCDPASVEAHVRLVAGAQRHLPSLFEDLNSLLINRTDVAHHRKNDLKEGIDLEHVDAVCRRVCDSLVKAAKQA